MIQIDMEMPKSCKECNLPHIIVNGNYCYSTCNTGRPEWCPLNEVTADEDTISRKQAIDALRDAENHAFNSYYRGLIKAHKIIVGLPSVQPQPQKTGRWIPHQRDVRGFADEFECSECERIVHFPYLTRICDYEYCPYCNAKMDGETRTVQ